MTSTSPSKDVTAFIDENVETIEELQVLLLLRSRNGKTWDAVDVANELQFDPLSASKYLMNLYSRKLIEHTETRGDFYGFYYHPLTLEKEQRISELSVAMERAKSDVVDYIFRKNRNQIQSLADAFLFRKEK